MNCIYKIVCKNPTITDFYIGSTNNLDKRKGKHNFECNNTTDRHYIAPKYMFINVNGGWNNWEIVVIKKYNKITLKELKIKEQYFIDKLNPTLNARKADIGMTRKQYKNIKSSEVCYCEICGKKTCKGHLKRHQKSKKCISSKLKIKT